jgi:hypothetical protein
VDVRGVDATGVHEADSGADTEVDKDREVSGVLEVRLVQLI